MLRYENIVTTVISVDLQNNYKVIAMANWNSEIKKYFVTLYIKRRDIDMLDLIEEQENVKFDSDMKSIRTDIAKSITTLLTDGFFAKYIERYEYEMNCFDRGNELFENERFANVK